MRALLIVIRAPRGDDFSSFRECPEPVLVKTLIAELPVEALHISVLGRLAGLDQAQFDAMLVSPLIERPTGELWSLVGMYT